ncbi:MAG: hypothetical protein HZC14_02960 [Candidatus Niyogibacteria bacterium]|nr:hypothetical protein [Candidatus Niyogibacteria bacterium]
MEGDIFHILNRGVEKRKIFSDQKDYLRFTHNFQDFNSTDPVLGPYSDRRAYLAIRKPGKQLVNILCWCLMPNHYHILVQEKIKGGASMFSKKVSSGYTQYFNLRNKRSGILFQGKSKIIPVQKDAHFYHLPYYILANPIKLVEPRWQDNGIQNKNKVIKFLENYKWSSYSELIKNNQSLHITDQNNFLQLFDINAKELIDDFTTWLSDSQV